jgi:hypothetical protein
MVEIWRMTKTPGGRYTVHARTGRRGKPAYIGVFGTPEAAIQAAEEALAQGPVDPRKRTPRRRQEPAQAVSEQVKRIVEEPPEYDWL